MDHATSADGTPIAFERHGDGPPVVIVGGALSMSDAAVPLARALADAGLQGVTMDRRARGESGDTAPYASEREVEDVAAVIGAVGGDAALLGHSSGAVLAHFAAASAVSVSRLFLSEPPYTFGEHNPEPRLPGRLQGLVDAGEDADAVVLFQREAVGLPEQMIEQIRQSPLFASLLPLAQSVVYDATLTRDLSTPTTAMREVAMPVTILRGEPTFPVLVRAFDLLHEVLPDAEALVVPESRDHGMDPAATARIVSERMLSA